MHFISVSGVSRGHARRVQESSYSLYLTLTQALGLIAAKKGLTAEALEAQLLQSGGPVFTGVKTDKVKLHDDKST